MLEQTDLDGIKKVAEKFLEFDLNVRQTCGVTFVSHPFFNSDIITEHPPKSENGQSSMADCKYLLIAQNPADLERAKEIRRKLIQKSDSAMSLFLLVSNSYRFQFFSSVEDLLSRDDLTEIWKMVWRGGEFTSKQNIISKKKLIELFESCNPQILMGPEGYEMFIGLPDELTVYRGIEYKGKRGCKKGMIYAMSWTPDAEVAAFFAKRFLTAKGEYGAIYEAKIKKENILACFAGNEPEILVRPDKLYDVECIEIYYMT